MPGAGAITETHRCIAALAEANLSRPIGGPPASQLSAVLLTLDVSRKHRQSPGPAIAHKLVQTRAAHNSSDMPG